jgi:hypothetical protein
MRIINSNPEGAVADPPVTLYGITLENPVKKQCGHHNDDDKDIIFQLEIHDNAPDKINFILLHTEGKTNWLNLLYVPDII